MSYFKSPYHRFFFLTGNTDDEFCPSFLSLMTFEEVLFRHLKANGYKRQIFYDGRRKIYFHDYESKRLCLCQQGPSPNVSGAVAGVSSNKKPTRICAGPLGQVKICQPESQKQTVPQPTNDQQYTESLLYSRMSDAEMPLTLNRFMCEDNPKTAVIFRDGLDFMARLDHDAQRTMALVLDGWGHLSSTNHNLCVFILQGSDMVRLSREMERHEWNFLLNKFFVRDNIPSEQVIEITSPRKDEVINLINYWRLKKNLETDWKNFSTDVDKITRNLCANGQTLKALSYELQQCTALNAETIEKLSGQGNQPPALERLRSMHGMDVVIEKVERLIARHNELNKETPVNNVASSQQNTVSRLLPPIKRCGENINLHIALKGNPGTGKTTVARLIAEIYRDNGLLETGHLVKASREDLVAGYVGQTAIKTSRKISEAMGGVLFVDEAYRLDQGKNENSGNDFGKEAVETIMEAMSNHKGEFAVIIAGYPQRIENFLDSNPGLRRRFSEINTITIPDYEPETLQAIFEQYVEKQGRKISLSLKNLLPDFFLNLYRKRNPETFGNAGEVVDNIYPAMEEHRIMRVKGHTNTDKDFQITLTSDDMNENYKAYLKPAESNDPDAIFDKIDHLIGLKNAKQQVRNLINAIKVQKRRCENKTLCPGHYVFTGNPGTGKTTVARLMGEIFYALGILQKGHLVETGRTDLVAGYLGQTAIKTTEVLNSSLDGVLFVDEAYALNQGQRDSFGQEAIDTIVAFMENNRDRLCLIIAGYPEPIENFLNTNAGLKSRFSGIIEFENYNAEEMLEIFKSMAKNQKMILENGLEQSLIRIFKDWETNQNSTFGNGRDVRKLLDSMCTSQNNRLAQDQEATGEALYILKKEDIG